jgi:release factor glutamine methyltransferase
VRKVLAQAVVRQHTQVHPCDVAGGHAVSVKTAAFGDLTITYDQRVLTPRAWTFHQSTWALELLAGLPDGPVLELCSGAGQIGLAVAAGSFRRLVCVDADPTAVHYTASNAAAAGLANRVEARLSRIDEALRPEERFPLILADPPWVPREDVARFPEDPVSAINGGAEGLEVARECIAVIETHLAAGGRGLLQLGSARQIEALEGVLDTAELRVRQTRGFDGGGVLALLAR